MDIQPYLQRIDYNGSVSPTVATLRDLHLAHVQSVPFENLDIHLGYPIDLELTTLFEKIVIRRRGGFCYELNKLFAWLLQELGFRVTLLSASQAKEDGTYDVEAHVLLQVECPADPLMPSTSWLSDVGYGVTFAEPLRLDKIGTEQTEQLERAHVYRIDQANSHYMLWKHYPARPWKKQYRITMRPREFTYFEPWCRYHQTSPESFFTQHRYCTLVTPSGRISLIDQELIIDEDGKRHKRPIGHDEYPSILRNQFGIDLGEQMQSLPITFAQVHRALV
jgi:N-hydroxyarylamine O-acetyltransferase